MPEDKAYKVGRNKPPLHTRFKKGAPSANPKGSRKAGPINVHAFFDQPLSVVIDGKAKKMHPLESRALSLLEKTVKNKDMRAAKRLIEMWADADLILDPNRGLDECGGYMVSSAWSPQVWWAKFEQLGPPPWPGRKNGMNNPNWREEALWDDD